MEPNAAILTPECTVARLNANSKKRALELAALRIAQAHAELDSREVFEALLTRERLGSTALGDGVAIPHCRVDCSRIFGACLSLASPVDFDAPDDLPVSLIFILVVPNAETDRHLKVLATLAEAFGDEANRNALVEAANDAELFALMSQQLG